MHSKAGEIGGKLPTPIGKFGKFGILVGLMDKTQWSRPVDGTCAARRAGGRRRHNAEAQRVMWDRRIALLELIAERGEYPPHGAQVALAQAFGVSTPTICRDLEACRKLYKPAFGARRAGVKIERHDRRIVITETAYTVHIRQPPRPITFDEKLIAQTIQWEESEQSETDHRADCRS